MLRYNKSNSDDEITPGRYMTKIIHVKPVSGAYMVGFELNNGQSFSNRYTLRNGSNKALNVLVNTVLIGSGPEVNLLDMIGKQVYIEVHHTEYNGVMYPSVKWVFQHDQINDNDDYDISDPFAEF